MKKNIKGKAKKEKKFSLKDKRAYIALTVLCVLIVIAATARLRAMKSTDSKTAFDDEAWRSAIAESNADFPETDVIATTEKPLEEDSFQAENPEQTTTGEQTSAVFEETVPTAQEDETEFTRPSKGSILKNFSGNEVVYSETMEDWRTHNGIDFAAEPGDQVVASSDGVVKKVYKDDLLGITVEIEHPDGVISRYSGLQSLDFIDEGKSVKSGDIIGGVGENGCLEQEDKPHLHFEIIKNGEYENPNLYFTR